MDDTLRRFVTEEPRKAERWWAYARVWLYAELADAHEKNSQIP